MIDANTVTAIVTAQDLDPDTFGVVTFYLPANHPDAGNGAVAAMLGALGGPVIDKAIRSHGAIGYGATPEEAAKALFTALATNADTEAQAAVAAANAKAAAKTTIDAAVAADVTAAALKV